MSYVQRIELQTVSGFPNVFLFYHLQIMRLSTRSEAQKIFEANLNPLFEFFPEKFLTLKLNCQKCEKKPSAFFSFFVLLIIFLDKLSMSLNFGLFLLCNYAFNSRK